MLYLKRFMHRIKININLSNNEDNTKMGESLKLHAVSSFTELKWSLRISTGIRVHMCYEETVEMTLF